MERRTRRKTSGEEETIADEGNTSNDNTLVPLEDSTILLPTTDDSFSSVFYEARAKVLGENWAKVESALGEYGMSSELNLNTRTVTIVTTSRTTGADIINKARGLLHLLTLTPVPPSMAIQILDDSLQYDIVWTGELRSQSQSEEEYLALMKCVQRNVKGLAAACCCSIFFNGISVTAMSKFSERLLLVRKIVTLCIVNGLNPGTSVRLMNLSLERNGETDNLEIDAYGFQTAPGLKLKLSDGNPHTDQNTSELSMATGSTAEILTASTGNPGGGHGEPGPLGDDSTPKARMEKCVFGPSVNKQGALVCGSFFFEQREQAVLEAWPELKSVLEDYGLSCTMYLGERFMTVSTTSRTENADIIYKAKDALELLSSTALPPPLVWKVLNGNLLYDIIKTGYSNGGLGSEYKIDKKLYIERHRCLGSHLMELAQLSRCSIYDDGNAFTAVGYKLQRLKLVRKIVTRCLVDNVDPGTMIRKVKLRRIERSKEMAS